jgi:DNA-binding NarL/FixJ family response regulator
MNDREADDEQTQTISVLIVEDHETVGLGLRALIESEPDIDVLEIVGTVAGAIETSRRRRPDVVLVDYRLPDGTGADAAEAITSGDHPPAVVMVTAATDRRTLAQALDAGCSGFVSKHADREDLVAAVRAAVADESYFTRDVLKHLAHLRRFDQVDVSELGQREIEVLQLTADGLTPQQIAAALFISPHTVKNHLRHAMAKLDTHTKLDAVVKAIRLRLISIDP